ncbi:pyridoxal phosphate-dependent transferase [Paraphoma chrysanthemicola]|uniref:Pyridoxal phosphate-dependent transferase n=1 Tax=Paraphoma chrysanthemicola TaxID=798071 RepID=A0A8K0VTF4_9PLEO|nr:pyridoxal phosphate-dependent transferase [Paraphoma chrysanthemicola]
MAPGAIWRQSLGQNSPPSAALHRFAAKVKSSLLHRSINVNLPRVKQGIGNIYILDDGTEIYDASGGAAVASLGKRDKRVEKAKHRIEKLGLCYVSSAFETDIVVQAANFMVKSTSDMMKKVGFYCSGSEANEAALKLACQYHTKDKAVPEPERTLFIAREQSYHGNTLGALDISGFDARRSPYERILSQNVHTVPPCNEYRNRLPGQTIEQYVQWHREQLVDKIENLGRHKVAAFIMEPIVGAALGCAPAVPGYLRAVREVCDHYGILLIFDEIMCGMGRTGYLHAWQAYWEQERCIPDIQLVGKGLAAGFAPVSAMLVGQKVSEALDQGPSKGVFVHGHTFQDLPLACAALLAVQQIVVSDNLLANVREKGPLLQKKLRQRLGSHPNVGDIRGPSEGQFLGIEFVQDKESKTPFLSTENINTKIFDLGLKSYGIRIYNGAGCADKANRDLGRGGDHIMICPAFNITLKEVDLIVDRVGRLIEDFFEDYDEKNVTTP